MTRGAVTIGLAMAVALSQPAAGQKPVTPPAGGNPSAGNPSRTVPGVNSTSPMPELMNRGLFLTGKVMLEDGTPPPDPVTIERVCGTAPRAEAYTDSKGRFNFQLGHESGVLQDASEEGINAPGIVRPQTGAKLGAPTALSSDYALMNCDLRANLAGYRSDSVSLSGRRMFDNPDIGTIVLHRMHNVEGSVISMTSLSAPKDARKAYEKARENLKKQKFAEAEKELQKAVTLYPSYAAAWFQVGWLQQHNGNLAQARQSYEKALAADPKFLSPYVPLAEMAVNDQKWQEVADITARALRLDPVDYPQMYLYSAMANFKLGHMDVAAKNVQEGKKLDTAHRYPKLDELLALIVAQKQEGSGNGTAAGSERPATPPPQ